MTNLKILTLFREYNYTEYLPNEPSIEDNKFILSDDIANEIANYLDDERYIALQFVSPTTDPYNKIDRVSHIICTDGVYVWDGVIIHWIRKYRVRLPNEFLSHFYKVKNNPVPQKILDELPLLDLMKTADKVYCEK